MTIKLCVGGPVPESVSEPEARAEFTPGKTLREVPDQAELIPGRITSLNEAISFTKGHGLVKDPSRVIPAKVESNFGVASANGEGVFYNEDFNIGGKGDAGGIAAGLINEKGVGAGGVQYATGFVGKELVRSFTKI